FGRREIHLSSAELRGTILYKLGALSGLARTLGFEITQVRPHGFLYRQLFHDSRTATTVARAIAEYDKWLVLIGPAGPTLLSAGERAGIRIAGEAWVDRAYDNQGNLLPHSHSRAVIKNPNEILNQASHLIRHGEVIAVDGTRVKIEFDTIHLHAQVAQAKHVAEQIRSMIPHCCSLTSEPFALGSEEDSELAYGVF
ncbi:MAG: LamB/YcsF family protein, partial [Terriglobales bacterium]